MASAAEIYTTELSRELRFLAAWTPGVPIQLGAIGKISDDHIFAPLSSISSFGSTLDETLSGHEESALTFASAEAVEVHFKLAGKTSDVVSSVAAAQAGLGIVFKRKFATVFRADGIRHHQISDQLKLARDVLGLLRAGEWKRDWFIVTHVVEADSTTALISSSNNAVAEFSLGANVQGGGLELLRAEFQPRVALSRDMEVTIVTSGGLTPLFRASRVRRRWFIGPSDLRAAYSGNLEEYTDDVRKRRDQLDELEDDDKSLENEFLDQVPVYDLL
jgi:hypothetical protein